MKNKLILGLALVGVVGTLVACGGGESNSQNSETTPTSQNGTSTSAAETRNLSIGVGTTVAEPRFDDYGNFLVEVNFATAIYEGDTVAASLVDVYQIKLDTTKAALKSETVPTKRDLHDDYAMKPASPIEKEWWEQAAALEAYTVGKTSFDGTSEELTAGCSMSTDTLFSAVTEAKSNAKEAVAVEKGNYSIALGHKLDVEKNSNDELTQINISFLGLLLDSNGAVVTSYLDEVQIPLTFNANPAEGENPYCITPTTAYGGPTKQYNYNGQTIASKKELHDDYAMKDYSNIEKEWWEQAAAFEDYLVGKTFADVNLESEELTAGCSMSTDSYKAAFENAVDTTLYNNKAIVL